MFKSRKVLFVFLFVLCLAGHAFASDSGSYSNDENKKISASGANGFSAVSSSTVNTEDKNAEASGSAIESIEATDQDGNKITVKVSDVGGLTGDWLEAAGFDPQKHTVKVELDESGKVKLLSIYDSDNNLFNRYDSGSRSMEYYHTEGTLKGKLDYVTSESERQYTWRDPVESDPGMGKDGHVIVQKFNYDSSGNIASVDYFTWTAGNRKKTQDQQKFSRYMYRQDTYKDGKLDKINYFDDPRPTFWEPTITGTVSKDNQGRIFLTTSDGKSYLLTARKDGFDADADGKVGAQEMSDVDWEAYIGKEITVRGHEIADENESDVYFNGSKAEMFGVVDVVKTDQGEKLVDGWEEVGQKVAEVMDKFFILVGDEKDVSKVYDKIYAQLANDLKDAGISDADIEKFADAAMKEKWSADSGKPDFSGYTDSQSLVAKAWEYFNSKDWANARAFSQETIDRYAEEAKQQQASLTDFASSDKAADYWALNDVGTAYLIIGDSYREEKEYAKARENYNEIISSYGFAQCWDTQGWWWKVKEAAQKALEEIQGK